MPPTGAVPGCDADARWLDDLRKLATARRRLEQQHATTVRLTVQRAGWLTGRVPAEEIEQASGFTAHQLARLLARQPA